MMESKEACIVKHCEGKPVTGTLVFCPEHYQALNRAQRRRLTLRRIEYIRAVSECVVRIESVEKVLSDAKPDS